jgi:hypothetical protein
MFNVSVSRAKDNFIVPANIEILDKKARIKIKNYQII